MQFQFEVVEVKVVIVVIEVLHQIFHAVRVNAILFDFPYIGTYFLCKSGPLYAVGCVCFVATLCTVVDVFYSSHLFEDSKIMPITRGFNIVCIGIVETLTFLAAIGNIYARPTLDFVGLVLCKIAKLDSGLLNRKAEKLNVALSVFVVKGIVEVAFDIP